MIRAEAWTDDRVFVVKFDATLTSLQSGHFNAGRQTTGTTIIVEAVARAMSIDVASAANMIANKTDDEIKVIKKHPSVVTAIAEIQLERAKAKEATTPNPDAVSIDALFA